MHRLLRSGARLRVLVVCAAACVLLAVNAVRGSSPSIALQLLADDLPYLIGIEHAGDNSGRLFLVEQTGHIRIYSGGQVLPTPFLDLSGSVVFAGEQGLLGLAFHPQYATNGVFFVHYVSPTPDDQTATSKSVVARYHVSASNPNVADPAGQILLTQDQPFGNHKGGQIAFGPDGYLYIALGDGGGGGDPQNNAQNLNTLLGKLLRIDVNNIASPTYAIPPGNLVAAGARPEIWAYGLRNPWRFSFDRSTGDLFIADVGQAKWEEINLQPAGAAGGRNYGWDEMEGFHCFSRAAPCDFGSLPVLEYSHDFRCSVTGGFRYRGTAVPALAGAYVFADYCSGQIWGAVPGASGLWSATHLLMASLNVSSFGQDAAGELYVADRKFGQLFRVVAGPERPLLSVSTSGRGAGKVTTPSTSIECGFICAAQLDTGTAVPLSATPDPGSTFVQWTGDADCADGNVTMTADRACTARFGAAFTDDTLAAGATLIKAVHITELRARLNAVRAGLGLAAIVWTDSTLNAGVTPPRAVHVSELQTAVTQTYTAAGRTPPTFTAVSAGTPIRGVFISELRLAVLLLED